MVELMNPLPVTVSERSAAPAVTEGGLMEVTVGFGGLLGFREANRLRLAANDTASVHPKYIEHALKLRRESYRSNSCGKSSPSKPKTCGNGCSAFWIKG
jgi:hypothetical protein